jgi:hypothetical protein
MFSAVIPIHCLHVFVQCTHTVLDVYSGHLLLFAAPISSSAGLRMLEWGNFKLRSEKPHAAFI